MPTGLLNSSRPSEPCESAVFLAERLADSITLQEADVSLQHALLSVLRLLPVPTHLARSSSPDSTIPLMESSVPRDTTQPPRICGWSPSGTGAPWVRTFHQPLKHEVSATVAIMCQPRRPRKHSKIMHEFYKMDFPRHTMHTAHVCLQLHPSSHLPLNPPSLCTILQTYSPAAQPLHSLKSI